MKNITYINAGAGSGKTYKLTETLADALKEGNYKPSEVILTTFTELAAAEFREKARAKLYERNMPEVAGQLAAATIGTVHSVALKFIQKYWYLIGVTPDPKVMTDKGTKVYTSQSLAEIITPEQQKFFEEYVDFFEIDNREFWRDNLSDLINSLDAYDIDLEKSRNLSLKTIDKIFPGDEVTLEEDLLKQFQSIILCDIHNYAQSKQKDYKKFAGAKISHDIVAKARKYCQELPAKNLSTIKAEMGETNFNRLANNLNDYLKIAPRLWMKKMVNHIYDIAGKWHEAYIDFKQNNHIIDFNDMERLFLKLLNNDVVKQEIEGTYRLLLVDEFQDSSPIQIDIFKRLAELMEHTYWVGDPKQSIFGFRGTDIELVKQLVDDLYKQKGTNGIDVYPLEESWRSRDGLVNLVSDCFVRAYDGMLKLDQVKLTPHRKEVPELNRPLSHWHLNGKNINNRASALAVRVKQLLDSHTKVVIKNTEKTRELQPGDIAILCSKKEHCKELALSLKKAGVPVAALNTDISQQTEVRLVIALLNMMVSPTNKHVRADVLHLIEDQTTQDILCNRLKYLMDLKQKPKDEQTDNWNYNNPLIQSLLDYRKQLANMSVSDMVQSIIYGLGLNEIVAKWGDRAERQQNLATIFDLARQYDQYCVNMGIGAAVDGFINYMLSITIEPSIDNAANAVKVLTYHKAKGLEWNYVILYGLEEDKLKEQDFAKKTFWGINELRQDDDRYLVQYLPRIWKTKNSNLDNSIIAALNNVPSYEKLMVRTRNELRNLLYVGMTRARDYLTTTAQANKDLIWVKNTGISDGEVANIANLWKHDALQPVVETLEAVDGVAVIPTVEQRVAYPEQPTISKEPKYITPSSMTLPKDETAPIEVVARFGDRMPHGRVKDDIEAKFGTCIHNIFAVYDPTLPHDKNVERAQRIRDGYNLFDALHNPGEVVRSIELLYNYLTETYGPAHHIEHEVPFVHVRDGQVIHGEIDLLWYTAPRECVLVDFKNFPGAETTLTNPADKHYAGRYAPQLQAYESVLSQSGLSVKDRLIYYSVLRRVVKL